MCMSCHVMSSWRKNKCITLLIKLNNRNYFIRNNNNNNIIKIKTRNLLFVGSQFYFFIYKIKIKKNSKCQEPLVRDDGKITERKR